MSIVTEDVLPWTMLLLGMALMTAILLRRVYRRRPKRPRAAAPVSRGRPIESHRTGIPLSDAPPDIARCYVELHESAREIQGELDTKIRIFQSLLARAQREADRLEGLLERSSSRGTGI